MLALRLKKEESERLSDDQDVFEEWSKDCS
jgi:hypothetical protein